MIVGISNGKEVPSLVSTSDELKHGTLRRSIAKAFSQVGALDYEFFVDQTIPDLVAALRKHEIVDLAEMLVFYSMDAANRLSFNEPLGCLDSESDVGGNIQLIRDRFNHWGWWSSIPGIEKLVYRNPIAMRMKRAPSSMAATAISRLKTRMLEAQHDINPHPDILHKFIQASHDDPNTLGMTDIVSLLMSTISGAGDTTASTLTAVIYNLLRHPSVLKSLRSELETRKVAYPPSFAEVNDLPLLNAVIKETMRIFSTPTWPMERKVPFGGVQILGVQVPEGTSVGCMPAAVHFNPAAFGEDAEMFRPHRWLEADGSTLRAMEAAHLGFSRGRRVCLGQHVAMLQMKKVVAVLILKFKVLSVQLTFTRANTSYLDESCLSRSESPGGYVSCCCLS